MLPELWGISRPICVQNLGLQTDPDGLLALEVRIALNCEVAFRFLGTFWLISKGRDKFISEIEKICIRGLGERHKFPRFL